MGRLAIALQQFLDLLALNVIAQENIGLLPTQYEWSLVDLPRYKLGRSRCHFMRLAVSSKLRILLTTQILSVICWGRGAISSCMPVTRSCPQLTTIVVMNDNVKLADISINTMHLSTFMAQSQTAYQAELDERIAAHNLSDLFTIIYTSGTTGEPKGVMLDYYNMAAQLYLHDERLQLTADDVSLSFYHFHMFLNVRGALRYARWSTKRLFNGYQSGSGSIS